MYRLARWRNDEGFTLIELLVVITILGVLAAVVVFSTAGISDRGQGSACSIDKRTIETAEEANFAKFGGYATEAALVTNGFLSAESTLYDVTPAIPTTTFDTTPAAGGPCT
ncbi:MAG: type II secretion system protein [Actinomycetota bacterium]